VAIAATPADTQETPPDALSGAKRKVSDHRRGRRLNGGGAARSRVALLVDRPPSRLSRTAAALPCSPFRRFGTLFLWVASWNRLLPTLPSQRCRLNTSSPFPAPPDLPDCGSLSGRAGGLSDCTYVRGTPIPNDQPTHYQQPVEAALASLGPGAQTGPCLFILGSSSL
jgi:hypothetical protein